MRHELPIEDELPGVITTISPSDGMFSGDREHYFWAGRSALECVRLGLQLAGRTEVRSILDFPCGHGRVLRALRAAFPNAGLAACDLDRDGVDFCARTFGATPLYSHVDPGSIRIDGSFDLIWVGSLFTHLDVDRWEGFLGLFRSVLAPGGVLLFTTAGRFVVQELRRGVGRLGLSPSGVEAILASFDARGYGFGGYPSTPEYGVCVASPSWVLGRIEQAAGLRLACATERGWLRRQDAFASVLHGDYEGVVDHADSATVLGWAWDAARPDVPVAVDLLDGARRIATAVADGFRQDLVDAGLGNGRHGFAFRIPPGSRDGGEHRLHVRISGTDIDLRRSPRLVRL
jgi:SAM-dependent methyltransferase